MRAWQKWSIVAVLAIALTGLGIWAGATKSEAARVLDLSGVWTMNFDWTSSLGTDSCPGDVGADWDGTVTWTVSMKLPFFGTFQSSSGASGYVVHLVNQGRVFFLDHPIK